MPPLAKPVRSLSKGEPRSSTGLTTGSARGDFVRDCTHVVWFEI